METYTVVGLNRTTNRRWLEWVNAENPDEAERKANDSPYVHEVAAVFTGRLTPVDADPNQPAAE